MRSESSFHLVESIKTDARLLKEQYTSTERIKAWDFWPLIVILTFAEPSGVFQNSMTLEAGFLHRDFVVSSWPETPQFDCLFVPCRIGTGVTEVGQDS